MSEVTGCQRSRDVRGHGMSEVTGCQRSRMGRDLKLDLEPNICTHLFPETLQRHSLCWDYVAQLPVSARRPKQSEEEAEKSNLANRSSKRVHMSDYGYQKVIKGFHICAPRCQPQDSECVAGMLR
ncbi:hypothetical protein EYF80_058959 [Liparis tanakae]|uniref:Uncharacterized protein n=1 Tax=Liparis tanakae TaxID=230148 RepID=A0A4Z2EQ12_9TELE|nr:hypothetical protein EYF80_058959 [Liparis tanakae]